MFLQAEKRLAPSRELELTPEEDEGFEHVEAPQEAQRKPLAPPFPEKSAALQDVSQGLTSVCRIVISTFQTFSCLKDV